MIGIVAGHYGGLFILSRLDSTMTSVRVESEDPNRKRPKIL